MMNLSLEIDFLTRIIGIESMLKDDYRLVVHRGFTRVYFINVFSDPMQVEDLMKYHREVEFSSLKTSKDVDREVKQFMNLLKKEDLLKKSDISSQKD